MTIAIYERVSTRDQKLDSQHADLATWAKGHENGQPVRWYSDKFTGKSMERPGMMKLLADIRGGRIKAVAVWRLDRLGRTTKGLTALFDELVALPVPADGVRGAEWAVMPARDAGGLPARRARRRPGREVPADHEGRGVVGG
jgi:hypothetical protein